MSGTAAQTLPGTSAGNSVSTAAGTLVQVPLGQRRATAVDRLPRAAATQYCH